MLNNFISIGNKLEINIENESNRCYLSQLQEIKDEKNLRIYAPIYEGKIVPLSIGYKYKALFLNLSGCYQCDFVLKNRIKKNNNYFMDIEIVSKLEKIQRRKFFRFKCLLTMKYIKLPKESNNDYEKKDLEIIDDGIVKDISGGGIRFVSSNVMEKGDIIQSIINLNNDIINVDCEIIYKNSTNNNYYKFEYRARFTYFLESDREKVLKYIYDEQRKEKLRKESGL